MRLSRRFIASGDWNKGLTIDEYIVARAAVKLFPDGPPAHFSERMVDGIIDAIYTGLKEVQAKHPEQYSEMAEKAQVLMAKEELPVLAERFH